MKKHFFLFIFSSLFFLFQSCDKEGTVKSVDGNTITVYSAPNGELTTKMETIILDSCEYLVYKPGMLGNMMTHKGNCKFCKERNESSFFKLYEDIRKLFLHYFKDEGDNSN